jgi:predicted ATPase
MIKSVRFKNFKVLRDVVLPLERFTLIVGPNGSGKSTAIEALQALGGRLAVNWETYGSLGLPREQPVQLEATSDDGTVLSVQWRQSTAPKEGVSIGAPAGDSKLRKHLKGLRRFSLLSKSIAAAYDLTPEPSLGDDGANLVVVLDQMRDRDPERFERLNREVGRCFPDFDRVLFETPREGKRGFKLRTCVGGHAIAASSLSDGTFLALAILTVAHLASPPSLVCLEEPDRGIHPRLLRDVRDALYRLTHPESVGESREPIQVIATTHSPYFLDLYRDHPEEVVIASLDGMSARFDRLDTLPNYKEILQDSHLGDAWYSGILGGVPAQR